MGRRVGDGASAPTTAGAIAIAALVVVGLAHGTQGSVLSRTRASPALRTSAGGDVGCGGTSATPPGVWGGRRRLSTMAESPNPNSNHRNSTDSKASGRNASASHDNHTLDRDRKRERDLEFVIAVRMEDVTRVNELLAEGASPDAVSPDGTSALWSAALRGDAATVAVLLKAGCSVNKGNRNGTTPLFVAALNGHLQVVERLLRAGASVDKASNLGYTAVMAATQHNHPKIVHKLLKAGANPNRQTTNGGQTALWSASFLGFKRVVQILLDEGATVNIPDKWGRATPLYIAVRMGYFDIASELIHHGANVTMGLENGLTPLHIASAQLRLSMIKLLLENGAKPDILDSKRRTPLDVVDSAYEEPDPDAVVGAIKMLTGQSIGQRRFRTTSADEVLNTDATGNGRTNSSPQRESTKNSSSSDVDSQNNLPTEPSNHPLPLDLDSSLEQLMGQGASEATIVHVGSSNSAGQDEFMAPNLSPNQTDDADIHPGDLMLAPVLVPLGLVGAILILLIMWGAVYSRKAELRQKKTKRATDNTSPTVAFDNPLAPRKSSISEDSSFDARTMKSFFSDSVYLTCPSATSSTGSMSSFPRPPEFLEYKPPKRRVKSAEQVPAKPMRMKEVEIDYPVPVSVGGYVSGSSSSPESDLLREMESDT